MAQRVKFGIYIPQLATTWDALLERARWVEELGFDSFWLMDHLYPPGLPAVPSFEGWTAATALLASTERLRVGHMVLCNNFRHPAVLGKMATTLDVISGGRFILGLGSGSVAQEHEEAGLPWGSFQDRTNRLEDALAMMTGMFNGERTTYEGRHASVHNLPNLPQPHTAGGPPILVGGGGTRTLELAARFASMWNCPTYALAALDKTVARLRAACDAVGRDPATLQLSTESVLVLVPTEEQLPDAMAAARRRYGAEGFGFDQAVVGPPDQVVETITAQAAKGITYHVFFLHDRGSRATLELLADKVLPRVP